MEAMRATDVMNANAADGYATIDGIMHRMFYAKSFEAKIEKFKQEIRLLNRRQTAHKTTGVKGTGSMTIYMVTPYYRKMVEEYLSSGKDIYFTLVVTNSDPESSVGTNTTAFYDVNIDSSILSKFNTGDEILEEEVSFTFDSYSHLSHFNDAPQS
jgi:hypothetical protein